MSLIARCPVLTQGLQCISGRCGMCNQAIEHNVAMFSERMLKGRLTDLVVKSQKYLKTSACRDGTLKNQPN